METTSHTHTKDTATSLWRHPFLWVYCWVMSRAAVAEMEMAERMADLPSRQPAPKPAPRPRLSR